MSSRPHAVVIGSGFGGLAAAIRLLVRGYSVTVLERLSTPGGRAVVFKQDGFTFDAGPTVITAPFMFEDLWQLCGKTMADEIDLRPIDPFYRIRFDQDGSTFDYSGDSAAMAEQINRLDPADVAGYEQFVAFSERIFKVGFTQLAHVSFDSLLGMARIVPQMLRLRSYRTVYGLVSQFVRNERLRQVLSFNPLLVGGNPFTTTSIYGLIAYLERKWGVHFPMGGTGALVDGLVRLIEEQGGELRYGATVDEIVVDGGRARGVVLEGGERIGADIVVSNADSAWTYRHLVPEHARKRWNNRRLDRAKYSMSLFVWYFGTNRRYDDVAHHTILLGPRYKGLLDDIFKHKRLAEDFSLYLHRATATDPSLAPDGCDSFYVLSPVPHLESGTDWSSEAERYRQSIEKYLSDSVLPGLAEHVVSSRVVTPQYFRENLLSVRGAGFSFAPEFAQSAYFRPHNRSEDVEGLYLVGAGTHPGAGLPGVLSSARVLDTVVPDVAAIA